MQHTHFGGINKGDKISDDLFIMFLITTGPLSALTNIIIKLRKNNKSISSDISVWILLVSVVLAWVIYLY